VIRNPCANVAASCEENVSQSTLRRALSERRVKHLQYWTHGRCISAALIDGCGENFLQPRKIGKFGLDIRQMRTSDALDFRTGGGRNALFHRAGIDPRTA
jgi:hypothetical protein